MKHYLFALVSRTVFSRSVGPVYPPTQGHVWPKPAHEIKSDVRHFYFSDDFAYSVQRRDCALLKQAIERCKASIASIEDIARKVRQHHGDKNMRPKNNMTSIRIIKIDLYENCENYPQAKMDESYNLTVTNVAKLKSNSIWGIIRGLETFSQLFYLSNCQKQVLINETKIVDYPQYEHRGLLIDTGRHYLSLGKILKTLDAMAMNKMNVLHWHIVDDESFPYQSEKFPELSAKGAYHPSMVYSKEIIRTIVEYARLRGIRVMLEIDGPGHAASWGASHPEMLSKCKDNPPFDPTKNGTFYILGELLNELQALFPEKYLHLGGDEVNTACWNSDPETYQYIMEHQLGVSGLHSLYLSKLVPLLRKGTTPVVWEEVFFKTLYFVSPAVRNTIVHIWGWKWEEKMVEVLQMGVKLIVSSMWYLDYHIWEYEFNNFYTGDPRTMVYNATKNATLGDNILGGEACMWGEMVDDNNLLSRVWPRASAIAEVLWSKTNGSVPKDAYHRLEEHTCRMIRRGIPAEPGTGSGFCLDKHNVLPPSVNRSNHNTTKKSTTSRRFLKQE